MSFARTEAAGRHENFTSAAAELGLTQAAVSYQVKALEDRLGAPLFVRSKGRAKLTALGARLLPSLTQAFDAIEAAVAAAQASGEPILKCDVSVPSANPVVERARLLLLNAREAEQLRQEQVGTETQGIHSLANGRY